MERMTSHGNTNNGMPGDRHAFPPALLLVFLLLGVICSKGALCTMEQPPNPGTPWPAVDGLGRALPDSDAVGPPRPDRFVGIFYFLWNGVHGQTEVYDVSKILAADPDALKNPNSPPWGPHGAMHFWGEPLFGYYLNSDPWVLRRHAHLLADAGVDTLIFDTTNRFTYRDVYMKLCEVFTQVRREGGRTPQITFMCNTLAGETVSELYNDLYKPGLYPDLWFRWQGKPLLICDPKETTDELRAFFTLRKAHWPFEQVNTPYAWHWEAAYPQAYGYTDDPTVPEQVNVSVAQNLRQADGAVTNMSNGDARGRSFHAGAQDDTTGAVNLGHNFAEQWERALKLAPPFVMVTGWNEWVAGRWGERGGLPVFVDQYNQEYSRDIEMARGAHGDNYYYQMVAGIRRYKGCPPLPQASAATTISLNGSFDQWSVVQPDYSDPVGDTGPRAHAGIGKLFYENQSGRNEFVQMKVACDDRSVFFYARTQAPISPPDGSNWMMLLINADGRQDTGWEGFEFIVNRAVVNSTTTTLERNTGGWKWERVAEVPMQVCNNELHLAIPRSLLMIPSGPFRLDFKWVDNPQSPGDPLDLYTSGDTAPQGRFRYRYSAR
jgi:hypothetical protein